mmetsp:Transcript_38765/g.101323  ORF Transcript_38765/g.101323 Transcript_38765/m.101323 type:complete len:209 (-) Transcript_38765:1304-1930(-)
MRHMEWATGTSCTNSFKKFHIPPLRWANSSSILQGSSPSPSLRWSWRLEAMLSHLSAWRILTQRTSVGSWKSRPIQGSPSSGLHSVRSTPSNAWSGGFSARADDAMGMPARASVAQSWSECRLRPKRRQFEPGPVLQSDCPGFRVGTSRHWKRAPIDHRMRTYPGRRGSRSRPLDTEGTWNRMVFSVFHCRWPSGVSCELSSRSFWNG